MSKILTVSMAVAVLLAAGSVSYHYLYTLPKQEAFTQCVQTYPTDWRETLITGIPTTPAALCAKGYSLTEFTQLLQEKARLAADDYRSRGADVTSQSVQEEIKARAKKDAREHLGI
jgi:hypothetical protein